jgi:hypothetical protein
MTDVYGNRLMATWGNTSMCGFEKRPRFGIGGVAKQRKK